MAGQPGRSGGPRVRPIGMPDKRGVQPVRVATGQPYGAAGTQAAALNAMPLPNTPPAGVGGPPPPAPAGPAPGTLTPLNAPTQRPGEPVTAGNPLGPGPGPEAIALPPPPPDPLASAAALLNGVSSRDPEFLALRNQINASLHNTAAP